MSQRYFTANHTDTNVIKKSSSGGMFTALTDEWFSRYGEKAAVYGCVLDENLNAKHIRATTAEARDMMRGSKYIQSDTSGVYKDVKNDLQSGNYVFYSGTPCQIAALKSFVSSSGIDAADRLFTLEIICHGVGSKAFFKDYISHLEHRYKSKAVKCSFRAKSRPGKSEDMEVVFENGKRYNASTTKYDWFYSAYIKGYIIRPSCFECRFARPERTADICVSDNWKDFYSASPEKHLSAVITCSDRGAELFEACAGKIKYRETDADGVYQMNLYEPSKKPKDYDDFARIYSEKGYLAAQKFLGNSTLKGYARSFVADCLYKLNLIETVKAVKHKLKK